MEQGPESTDGAEGRRAHPFGLEESKSHGEEEEKEEKEETRIRG